MTDVIPSLSIGLPVYNGERYLRAALDALLGQTYRDLELVIGDNASTDSTEEICRAYLARDARIRYYRHPRNLGAPGNFNFVLRMARGRYFKWASHDDLYEPDYVARCIAVLERDPGVVLCSAQTALLDDLGRRLSDDDVTRGYYLDSTGRVVNLRQLLDLPRALGSPSVRTRFREYNLKTIAGDDIYGVMRTDAIRRVAPYGNYFSADSAVMAELCLMGRVEQVPERLFLRRAHSGQSVNLTSERARRSWARPARSLPIAVPRFALTRGRIRPIFRVDLAWHDRAYCLLVVLFWCARQNVWRRLFPWQRPELAHRFSPGVPRSASG